MKIRRHGHDDRWWLFLNCGLIVLLGACAIIVVGLLPDNGAETVPAAGAGAEASKESAEAIAREFLTNIGELPAEITSARIERYWVPANNYWEQGQKANGQKTQGQQAQPSAQETLEEPPYLDCWVVTFYFQGLHPEAWKTVFVDVASGAVIGGADCRH
ncbi:MAG TPA: hypothetical protein DHD79_09250 [Firmicutes bacterium]|nr:hypothetical protein [Bacillota bacterium]HAW70784.1 hypothetical protein [Bacillota bacterium]HAZ20731.1 hypothetical protein [Bacillota bacterium]HBE06471.1 hypothetical protein [Bacillota bacterium]HBG44776.1 hypothetical protein [Bacillota bacterium]